MIAGTRTESPARQERPVSPVPGGVSKKSSGSILQPIDFKDGDIFHSQSPARQERPVSPVPGGVSKKISGSILQPIDFKDGDIFHSQSLARQERSVSPVPGGVSMKSSGSILQPIDFKDGSISDSQNPARQERPVSPVPGGVSKKSSGSILQPIDFKDGDIFHSQSLARQEISVSPVPGGVSMKSSGSILQPIDFKDGGISDSQRHLAQWKTSKVVSNPSLVSHVTSLDSTFTLLEDNIITFVKDELKRVKKFLGAQNPECSDKQTGDDEVMGSNDDLRSSNRDSLMGITLNFLRKMNQEQLADILQKQSLTAACQHKLKFNLKRKFRHLFEGIAKAGNPTLLNDIYIELYITQGDSSKVNDQHEVPQNEAAQHQSSEATIGLADIFKPLTDGEPVRTLVTKGVAGIGKTALTQKYILDWAESEPNHDIQFIFPLSFRELSLMKQKKYSLVELIHYFFNETKEAGICKFEQYRVVFIFDGLDECSLHLDFHNYEILTDVTEPASVEVLLTNLVRGKLLPSAHLWITSRPAAASQIPPECIDMVTELRGFSDPQKEEYFRKSIRDEEMANRIISHIKTSRTLHSMCHIPVFCWISAVVLEYVLESKDTREVPKTLTEMYIHFLLVQTKLRNVKYHRSVVTDEVWTTETKTTVLSLGKLAFEQLEKGNLMFYESDLREYRVDVQAAAVNSGLLTEIIKDEHGMHQEKVFCFVHRSIQGFLAALYVFLTFVNTGINTLKRKRYTSVRLVPLQHKHHLNHLFEMAVDMASQSPNGHLDLFLRFLLGLSLQTNQILLKGLLKKTEDASQARHMIVQYIKRKLNENPCQERSINLLHCLNELNDNSLVEEVQQYLRSGNVSEISSSQWSALVFILLSSQESLDEFDLKKFSAPEEGLLHLLPVIKASTTSLMDGCGLSSKSCHALIPVMKSENSCLRKLDLSHNNLHDSGAMLLAAGLKSPHCRLEILRLSGCQITEKGCSCLAFSLKSNPSYLRELDLSFNHPGDSGVKMLSAGLDDPQWKLETLKFDNCGKCRLKPSPLKYFCQLSLDPNTVHRNLLLFPDNKCVVAREKQPYPDHPDRFDEWQQLLCHDGLTGHSYWEVYWRGRVSIGVAYRDIKRSGHGYDACFGWNDQSWSVICTPQGYTAWHNNTPVDITPPQRCSSGRIGVYLDWSLGTVSFYFLPSEVSSIKRIHLHTFHSTFTAPLYAAFGFGRSSELATDSQMLQSSIYLAQMEE
ncbi:protein NLRC3-like [Antennarius striatus]|uniref:protein NLRC3-like n=1 Tax=Antennarius striatus TaxID=241820 RepID=UPI0035AEC123